MKNWIYWYTKINDLVQPVDEYSLIFDIDGIGKVIQRIQKDAVKSAQKKSNASANRASSSKGKKK